MSYQVVLIIYMSNSIMSWLLGGSLGSLITFAYNYWENKKKLHFSNVTNQRIKWTDEIKKNIAEFISGIQSYRLENREERKKRKIDLITKMEIIQLNLNFQYQALIYLFCYIFYMFFVYLLYFQQCYFVVINSRY